MLDVDFYCDRVAGWISFVQPLAHCIFDLFGGGILACWRLF